MRPLPVRTQVSGSAPASAPEKVVPARAARPKSPLPIEPRPGNPDATGIPHGRIAAADHARPHCPRVRKDATALSGRAMGAAGLAPARPTRRCHPPAAAALAQPTGRRGFSDYPCELHLVRNHSHGAPVGIPETARRGFGDRDPNHQASRLDVAAAPHGRTNLSERTAPQEAPPSRAGGRARSP